MLNKFKKLPFRRNIDRLETVVKIEELYNID